MQSTIDILKTRRSVKDFNDKKVSKEDLDNILSAAVNAPTGMNAQSPKILVIQRKDIIERFAQWNKSFYPEELRNKLPDDFDPFYNASTLIFLNFAVSHLPTQIQGIV